MSYRLRFLAIDSQGLAASVERVVVVVSPCASGTFLCGDECSEVRAV